MGGALMSTHKQNTKMEKENDQVSSLCVTMLPVKTEYVQKLYIMIFLWNCVYFRVKSSWASSRTVWSW